MKKLGEKETLWETGEKESFYVFKNSMEPVNTFCRLYLLNNMYQLWNHTLHR